VLGDAAHKRVNPILARREEQIQTWLAIEAPVLWIEGRQTDMAKWWGDRYPRSDFEERLAVVRSLERHTIDDCGHMMHLDQPQAVAERIDTFLDQ
jgi:pimeloyl-ACP methyl ester carboxylesterase